ncbi:hypothetical protein O1611_g8956 [Lasiodiplodia mahajangana]|uniref:Uncharacterized protein n=1 Tax=Lasiodiplodia mahajangana TaxID=1108764 RepID=A0ACC2JB00_9PEZI|nr:hypothetical protein O1611_g8956 [Lasiodiplodia mahajangana]
MQRVLQHVLDGLPTKPIVNTVVNAPTPLPRLKNGYPDIRRPQFARLAQSVERETLNLKVAGSTPASGSIPDASQAHWE